MKRIDQWLQSGADRLLWAMEHSGIHAPKVLRELMAGTMASNALLAIASLVQTFYLSVPIVVACAWFCWMIVPQWRHYADDARKDWTPEMAQKYVANAMRKRSFYDPSRPLMLFALIPYGMVFAMFAASQFGIFYLAILIRMIVLQATFYIEGAIPTPPPAKTRFALDPVQHPST